jgi:RimJ/RimL family protein N-acetyltransferase
MAFGPIMQLKAGDLSLELAPLAKADMGEFVAPGMQRASITKYLGRHVAPVLEDELEWFERTRTEKDSLIWGIYVVGDKKRQLIGNTGLSGITSDRIIQATSGSMIFRKEFWGKGIASHIHKARTWYAFKYLGHTRVMSAVIHGNVASLKALEKTGYSLVYVERNTVFIDGRLSHQDNLECLNPSPEAWKLWWGSDRPTSSARRARQKTLEALTWAEQNVTLL